MDTSSQRQQQQPARPWDEDRPGDAVCWLRMVCPECGAMAEDEPPADCPQCGARIEPSR